MSGRDLKDTWSKAYREHPAAWDLAQAIYHAHVRVTHLPGGMMPWPRRSAAVQAKYRGIAADLLKSLEPSDKEFPRLAAETKA